MNASEADGNDQATSEGTELILAGDRESVEHLSEMSHQGQGSSV